MQEAFKLLVGVAIPLAAFITGLRACNADLLWLWKRPSLLVRSLLAVLVLVPLWAVLFLQVAASSEVVKYGVTDAILAVGLGPAAALQRAKAERQLPYEVGLNVTLLLASIVFMPIAVALHGAAFGHHLHLPAGQVAWVVLTKALVPLGLGLGLGRMLPRLAAPFVRYGGMIVNGLLLAVVLVALLVAWRSLLGIGGLAWLTAAAVAVGAVLIGHLLGGPDPETRGELAAFSAMRFPALALLLASFVPRGKEFIPIVLAYVIASGVVVTIQSAVVAARARHRPAPSRVLPRPGAPAPSK